MRLQTLASMSEVEIPFEALRTRSTSAVDVVVQLHAASDGTRRIVACDLLTSQRSEPFRVQPLMRWSPDVGGDASAAASCATRCRSPSPSGCGWPARRCPRAPGSSTRTVWSSWSGRAGACCDDGADPARHAGLGRAFRGRRAQPGRGRLVAARADGTGVRRPGRRQPARRCSATTGGSGAPARAVGRPPAVVRHLLPAGAGGWRDPAGRADRGLCSPSSSRRCSACSGCSVRCRGCGCSWPARATSAVRTSSARCPSWRGCWPTPRARGSRSARPSRWPARSSPSPPPPRCAGWRAR